MSKYVALVYFYNLLKTLKKEHCCNGKGHAEFITKKTKDKTEYSSGIKSDLPEPDDDRVIWVVTIFIFGVFSPVVDVHVS